jgi:hypothetical protein
MTAAGVQLAARRGQRRRRIGTRSAFFSAKTQRPWGRPGGDFGDPWGAGGEGAAAEAEESRGFALVEFGKDKNLQQHPAR